MHPDDFTEYHIPVPENPDTQQKHFVHTTSAAAKLAMQDFDTRIMQNIAGKTETAKKMRTLLRQEYDWKSAELSIKQMIDQLAEDKAMYLALAQHLHSPEDLYRAMETVANAHLDELMFDTNNYPLATLRHDQFVHFLGTVSDVLRDEGLLTSEDERFKSLLTGYRCAMLGYERLREKVFERTKGTHASLMEWTSASTVEKNPEAEEYDGSKAAQLMARRYRAIFRDWGLNAQKGGLVPVAYAYLLDLAEKISVREAEVEHPNVTDMAALKKLSTPHMKQHLHAMMAMNTNITSLAQIANIDQYLLDAYAIAFHLPRDFSELTKQSCKNAEELALAALPRLEREAIRDQNTIRTSGQEKLEAHGVQPYSNGVMGMLAPHWFKEIARELESADNLQEIVQIFQEDADMAIHETSCGLQHPGMTLLRRSYVEAFGKALEKQLKERNASEHISPPYDVREVRKSFETLSHKYEQAYECHWDIANWCLRFTEGAYSDFGQYALSMAMAAKGKNYDALSMEERIGATHYARHYVTDYAVQKGVPEAWASHPLMPRLYQATLVQAAEDESRRMAADYSVLPNDRSRTKPWSERELKQIHTEKARAESAIDSKQSALLEAVVAQMPSGYPDRFGHAAPSIAKSSNPYDTTPYIDAATLRHINQLIGIDRPASRAH